MFLLVGDGDRDAEIVPNGGAVGLCSYLLGMEMGMLRLLRMVVQ